MKTILVSLLLLISSLNASETQPFLFKTASHQEASEIEKHLTEMYGQNLYEAGLYENLDLALEAATLECNEDLHNPNKDFHYSLLTSPDSLKQYGYLTYSITEQTAYLEGIYIDPAYRGLGLSKKLLQEYELELKNKNIDTLKLYVFAKNTPAFTLYCNFGYEIETTYYEGSKAIGHHMQKTIGPISHAN